jgi:hypothetical protein
MKNNNMLNNNTNVSFLSKNKNLIVLGIIVVFLIIIGVVLYRTGGDFSLGDQEIIEDTISNLNISHPPVYDRNTKISSGTCGETEDDPGNVKLLNNVRDRTIKEELDKNQVYNISNNIFSYEDARAACKAHGSELATYHQVLDTYKKGGEWCNYGWSEGQMALYPTQKDTWDELQKDPEGADTCGNWGVNGGYFDNPNTLFGANCYGVKPEPKDREQEKVLSMTKNQKIMLDKINMYKSQRNELTVLPFNRNIWSEKGKLN